MFYVLFEVMLLVMYVCVCAYVYNSRSVYAMYMLVAYTVVGSSAMACGMLLQYITLGAVSSLHGIDNYISLAMIPTSSILYTSVYTYNMAMVME